MFLSQDDECSEFTPRDAVNNHIDGPAKKRGKSGPFSHLFENSSVKASFSGTVCKSSNIRYDSDTEFNLFKASSQDVSLSSSQFSQDFSDRLGQLNFRGSQDNTMSEHSFPGFNLMSGSESSNMSWDGNSIPFVASKKAVPQSVLPKSKQSNNVKSTIQNSAKNSKRPVSTATSGESERQIDLTPPVMNLFLTTVQPQSETYLQLLKLDDTSTSSGNNKRKRITKTWISAFKQPSRYVTDYEEIYTLGEGNFSVVTACRHRLDGRLYAIKQIKQEITSNKQFLLFLREVHALSLLQDCPQIVQYHNTWVDSDTQKMFIQTELCECGTLEDLISPQPSISSCMRVSADSSSSNTGGPTMTSVAQRDRAESFNFNISSSNFNNDYLSECYTNMSQATPSFPAFSQSTQPPISRTISVNGTHVIHGIVESLAWVVLEDMCKALEFMHTRGLVHLDIRPANIFLTCNNNNNNNNNSENDNITTSNNIANEKEGGSDCSRCNGYQVNRADSSSHFDDDDEEVENPYLKSRESVESELESRAFLMKLGDFGHCTKSVIDSNTDILIEGENRYCARELINSDERQLDLTKADVFSLGASIYELCLGRYLGSGGEGTNEWHSLRDGLFDESVTNKYSREFVSMLRLLLHTNPTQRPTASAVLSHCVARKTIARKSSNQTAQIAATTTSTVVDLCCSPMSPSVHNTSFWVSDGSQTSCQSESQGDCFSATAAGLSQNNNNKSYGLTDINSAVGGNGSTMVEVTPRGQHTTVYHYGRLRPASSAAGLVTPTTPSMMDHTSLISTELSVGFDSNFGGGRVSAQISDNCGGIIFPLSAASSVCNSAVKAISYGSDDNKQTQQSETLPICYEDILAEMERLKRENDELRKRCLLV